MVQVGLSGRVDFQAGDYLQDELPGEQDVVLLFNIMHGCAPEQNSSRLKKAAQALRPRGRVVVVEQLADHTASGDARAIDALLALAYFHLSGRQAYRFSDIRGWMDAAGLWYNAAGGRHHPSAGDTVTRGVHSPMSIPFSISPAALGFVRAAVITPELRVADVVFNTHAMIDALAQAAAQGCRLALCPELSITGYSCADLFDQAVLLDAARAALAPLAAATAEHDIALVVGLPLPVDGKLYNCAAFLAGGAIQGIVPKTYLPTTGEFYEARWFTPAIQAVATTVEIDGAAVPFGRDLLFAANNLSHAIFGIEICEDLWAVSPPSGDLALAGATVLLNPSASNELLGKEAYRRDLVRQQSARSLAAYLYAGSGANESTTDLVWAGHSLIAENGVILAETTRFQFTTQMAVADIDVQRLVHSPDSPPVEPHALRAGRPGAPCRTRARDLQHPAHRPGQTPQTYRHRARHDRCLRRARFNAGVAGDRQGLRRAGFAAHGDRRHQHARFWHDGAHAR